MIQYCIIYGWPNGNVFYTFGTRLLAAQDRSFQFAIRDALNKWEEQTCLRFFSIEQCRLTTLNSPQPMLTNAPVPVGIIRVCNPKFVGNNGSKQVIELAWTGL